MVNKRCLAVVIALVVAAVTLVGCTAQSPVAGPAAPVTLVVASHDSFAASEAVIAQFEQEHNVKVQFLTLGDAGAALNKIILSKDAPVADLFYGVDNTFLSRAVTSGAFEPYTPTQLSAVAADLQLDASHSLTPIDYGFVNLNADAAWFKSHNVPLPTQLEDLIKPEYKGLLVAPNPATSSPGLAFLLTTISYFGEDGYLDYWRALRANDLLITDGWSEAYFDHFTVGSGGKGDRPLVVSYTTSPPADVVYATDGRTAPASINVAIPGSAFRQVEFAGVLKGARQPELARKLIDFMLGREFQEDIPLQMFVFPVNQEAQLPELFTAYAQAPADPVIFDASAIDQNRERWLKAWSDVVLR
ncbi:MAG: thiamine ABC transporter substrate-binding protein [Anaerolineales bacterium]|nr:thiamine ABC transporter substrate-binding protein [Anaerolineales bacterium]